MLPGRQSHCARVLEKGGNICKNVDFLEALKPFSDSLSQFRWKVSC